MIGFLKGNVFSRGDKSLLLLTSSGVGYTVFVPDPLLGSSVEGSDIELFIETIVREDSITLYGFKNAEEKSLFLLLIEVNKVGPKLALTVLSAASSAEIVSAIVHEDAPFFKNISGIGKKTAEKIIIDLKDKVKNFGFELASPSEKMDERTAHHVMEAETGLVALGYNKFAVKNVLAKIKDKNKKRAEDIVREALRLINEK